MTLWSGSHTPITVGALNDRVQSTSRSVSKLLLQVKIGGKNLDFEHLPSNIKAFHLLCYSI